MYDFNQTEIIAIIGCITGVSSFLITFIRFFNERQRLKIICEKDATVYFNKLIEFTHFNCDKQGIARFRIINKSRLPITIYKILVRSDETRIPIEIEFPRKSITLDNDSLGIEKTTISLDSQLLEPIELQPFGSIYGYFFLAFLPKNNTENYTLKFKFFTSRRNKCKTIRVRPIYECHSNCNNNH